MEIPSLSESSGSDSAMTLLSLMASSSPMPTNGGASRAEKCDGSVPLKM